MVAARLLFLPMVLAVTVRSGGVLAKPPTGAMAVEPQANLAQLHISYWRVSDDFGSKSAAITIDERSLYYVDRCEAAEFSYKQNWKSEGQLDVFPENSDWACSGEHSSAFFRFYRALRQSDSVVAAGDTLTFSWANQPLMRLQRFEPDGLEIRRWKIEEYLDERGLRAPDPYVSDRASGAGDTTTLPPPTITFAQGALAGSPGCGGLGGDYQLTGRSLLIHPETILLGHCSASSMLQNDRIEEALRRVRHWDMDGRQVILRGDKGEIEVALGLE